MTTRARPWAVALGCILALLPVAGGTQAAVPSPGAAPAQGWVRESMPYLGYTVDLPASWERVGGDPSAPVPSIDEIAARDQVTADALAAAAQRIGADGGLLDTLGLWAVDPATLTQVGVVTTQPYRIEADALQDQVDASIARRASDLQDPVVEPVSFPVGAGFRATYLDATDLAQHQELHLRTPTGRSLILAASIPGAFDADTIATIDAVAGSLAPIPGSSGDLPAPSSASLEAAAAAVRDRLPARVGKVDLQRDAIDGESLVGTSGDGSGALASGLGVLVDAPADLTLGIAVPATMDSDLLIAAYRLDGIDPEAVEDLLASFPDLWDRARISGVDVLVSPRADDGGQTWLLAGELADGSAALFQVDASNPTLGRAAVSAIVAGR